MRICIGKLEGDSDSFSIYNAAIKKVGDFYQAETRRNSNRWNYSSKERIYVLYQIRRLTKYL
jgi:hypothetical protein